jgi:hypothetical protein
MINPQRTDMRQREALSTLVDSAGWQDILATAENDILKPLRSKLMNDPELDPREQTGCVRALKAVRQLIELPYKKLADSGGHKLEDVMPERVRRLFT